MGVKEQLGLLPEFKGGSGSDAADVKAAERALGLSFARDYRDYLLVYGTALCDGHELTGISHSKRLDVVAVTEEMRAHNPQTPANLYVIEVAAIDGIVVWQHAQGVVWQTAPGASPLCIAGSLVEYLRL